MFTSSTNCHRVKHICFSASHASWAWKFAGKKMYWKWWWWHDQWQSETQLVKTMLKLIYKNYKRPAEKKSGKDREREKTQIERIFCRLLLLRASHLIISCNHFNGTSFTELPLLSSSSSWSSPLHDFFSSSHFSLRFGKKYCKFRAVGWRCRYIWLK